MSEVIIEMNTGNGESIFTTSNIKGFLESITLISEEQVSITINSSIGYGVFSRLSNVGNNLFMVRYPTESPLGLTYTDHVDKLCLNEKLMIKASGKLNTDIKIIIRYS